MAKSSLFSIDEHLVTLDILFKIMSDNSKKLQRQTIRKLLKDM